MYPSPLYYTIVPPVDMLILTSIGVLSSNSTCFVKVPTHACKVSAAVKCIFSLYVNTPPTDNSPSLSMV
mgnify:CR=1 FL=1